MKRHDATGRTPAKARRRKAKKPKRSNRPKAARDRGTLAASQVTDIARLTSELSEALERQTATADVLRVISSSPSDLQPVFDAILDNAVRICRAENATLFLYENGVLRRAARYKEGADSDVPIQPSAKSGTGRLLATKKIVYIPDYLADPAYLEGDPFLVAAVDRFRIRTGLHVPMLKENELVGTITIWRTEVRPFTDKQIEMVQNFAAQAVIAIENARLLNELRELLERQTGTSDVLRVISTSPGDLQPVFDAMLENAVRICAAHFGVLNLHENGVLRTGAMHDVPRAFAEFLQRSAAYRPTAGSLLDRVMRTKQVGHVADNAGEAVGRAATLGGARSIVVVPMLKDDELIGTITLYRQEVRPFTEKQIELVQNFAAQAVIAIENARLLSELRELLAQQTATSEVLSVISSSPSELDPVFEAILANGERLCEANFGVLALYENGAFRVTAMHNVPRAYAEYRRREPLVDPRPGTVAARLAATKDVVHILDYAADVPDSPLVKLGGGRSSVSVPMLKEGELVGLIQIYRKEVRPFTDKQIALLKNFAAQAVIAIENARLLNELRERTTDLTERTADLTESLEQQTATANVLAVISRSAFDLDAVFETVAESSVRLCGADRGAILRYDGELMRVAATYNATPEFREWVAQRPIRPGRHSASARAALERRTIHIPDVRLDPEYTFGAKAFEETRTILGVPILKGDDLLGVMIIYHVEEVRPFTDKQIALVETFADQAAIAIENVRLLDELRHRTDELGRSVGELRALGEVSQAVNSTLDLQNVLETIVARAVQLSATEAGAIYVFDNLQLEFHLRATYGMDQELITALTEQRIRLDEPIVAQVLAQPEPIQVADLREGEPSAVNEVIMRAGFRALLVAPLRGGEDLVGMLVVRRRTPGAFPQNNVDLMKTFAAQSALAIQNARLFHEIEEKSRQLAEASQHKSQFLANMSHELRTPLNAILGYTELMADGAYGEPSERMVGVLKRLESNGKHLLGLINDVLDLSKIEAGQLVLDLADYSLQDVAHTVYCAVEPLAADKKLKFTTEVAPDLPRGRGDERRLTQVLLNLVGNAIKFTDAGEVAIKVSVANGAFNVAIQDTGPGISAADQAKLFQEFQQADDSITKKKGGTGLGLAISKRIVEMHGGRIWIDSIVGQGSTFAFTVPVHVTQQVKPS